MQTINRPVLAMISETAKGLVLLQCWKLGLPYRVYVKTLYVDFMLEEPVGERAFTDTCIALSDEYSATQWMISEDKRLNPPILVPMDMVEPVAPPKQYPASSDPF